MKNNFIYSEKLEFIENLHIYEFYCEFNQAYFNTDLFDEMGIQCPSDIRNASAIRQAEFLAGRYAAQQVLDAQCVTNYVDINKGRSPIWPDSVKGSISHTSNKALCSAGEKKFVKDIGVDIEPWLTSEVADEIKYEILNIKEILILSKINFPFPKLLTLCFSAKESLYKALGRYSESEPEFWQLEVMYISLSRKVIALRLVGDLSSSLLFGQTYTCVFRLGIDTAITRFVLACDCVDN
jgi:enterobactin synthetase component D